MLHHHRRMSHHTWNRLNAAPATKTARADQNELEGWKHDGGALALEWKELSRACGEMLNRNVEINVMLWFSAQKTQIVTLRSREKNSFILFST